MEAEWIRKPATDSVIVFVHGILSSANKCWTHKNGASWPKLVEQDEALAQYGVFSVSYWTGVRSGQYSVDDIVSILRDYLHAEGILDCRRIIFVCHSMGGIVARRLLVAHQLDLIKRGMHVGLFLVSSPSLGSQYAAWLEFLIKEARHLQADILRPGNANQWLLALDGDFKRLMESKQIPLRGKEIYESDMAFFKGLRPIVERASATAYFPEPIKIPDSTHFSIPSPADHEALQYLLFRWFVLDLPKLPEPLAPGAQPFVAPVKPLVDDLLKSQYIAARKMQWRPLSSVDWPIGAQYERHAEIWANSLTVAFIKTFADKYQNFSFYLTVEQQHAQGADVIIYGLVCHKAGFVANFKRMRFEELQRLRDASLAGDEAREQLKHERAAELAEILHGWSFRCQVTPQFGTIAYQCSYDPESRALTLTVQPPSLDPSDYEGQLDSTSELLRYIASSVQGGFKHINYDWFPSSYRKQKLLLDVMDHGALNLGSVRVSTANDEEWDYVNLTFDEENAQLFAAP